MVQLMQQRVDRTYADAMCGDEDARGGGKESVTVGATEVFARVTTEVGSNFVGACDGAAEEDETSGTEVGQKGEVRREVVAKVEESTLFGGLGRRHCRGGLR